MIDGAFEGIFTDDENIEGKFVAMGQKMPLNLKKN